jgi:predicted unusual protein kinase regulating ubiquinone biosynthesis (AarF/ABC1/UbiB family)
MERIDGVGLTTFIENSTQEERNKIGRYIVEFIFVNFYKYGLFYPDIHYGNFLVKDNSILYVTDFGCLNELEADHLENMIELHKAVFNKDEERFYELVLKIGIMKEDISQESKEYMYEYFILQYSPWTQEEFEFTEEWLVKSAYKKTVLMKEWVLPSNCIYFNKICYGAYHIFTKLKMKGSFVKFFTDLIKESQNEDPNIE